MKIRKDKMETGTICKTKIQDDNLYTLGMLLTMNHGLYLKPFINIFIDHKMMIAGAVLFLIEY